MIKLGRLGGNEGDSSANPGILEVIAHSATCKLKCDTVGH